MKNSGAGVATGVSIGAIAAVLWLLMAVAAAHPGASVASRGDLHCTASSQAATVRARRAAGRLVPQAASALTLCRYGPAPAQTLEGSRLLTAPGVVHRVVRGLNALPAVPPGPVACPADDGAEIVVYAMYRRSATRIVHVALSGCLIARSGNVVRWDTPSGGRFARLLEHLTR